MHRRRVSGRNATSSPATSWIFCGDWEPLAAASTTPPVFPFLTAPPAIIAPDRLRAPSTAPTAPGGTVAAVERGRDASTLWAATSTGRVFVSKNADAEPFEAVIFTRIDPLSALDPNRFVSGIFVDPTNPNRAWLSYSGYSAATPATPGHVFVVVYDPVSRLPPPGRCLDDSAMLALARLAGDGHRSRRPHRRPLRVHRLRRACGGTRTADSWAMASDGMPNVEVARPHPRAPSAVVCTPPPTASAPGA